jgi:NAD-dependent SIR2 family protein deacetylase
MCEKDLDCDLLIVIGTSFSVDGGKRSLKHFARDQILKVRGF